MQLLDKRPSAPNAIAAVKDSLDQRIDRIFDGNTASTPERKSSESGALRSEAVITLSLGWWRTSQSSFGAFHPSDSDYCRDFADLDQISCEDLNAAIANPAEAAALQRNWQGQALSLLAKHGTKFDVRQWPARWHYHERCAGCYGEGKVLCMSCYGGKTQCSSCGGRRGEHRTEPTMTAPGVYRQVWITCLSCNGHGTTTCSFCRGSCRTTCFGCYGHGYSTHTFEAKITAGVEVAHGFYGDNTDVAGDMAKLPLDTLFEQSNLSPIQAEPLNGGVRFRVSAETAYHVRAYDIDGWEFQFCAVGHDNLIPAMPPILDHVLGDLSARILSEKSPARIQALTSESAITRDILQAIGGIDGCNLANVRRSYESSMSSDLFEKVSAAVKRGYDGVAGARGRKIWLRNTVITNVGLFSLYKTGASAALVKLTGQQPTPAVQTGALILLALALLVITWTSARSSALREAKKLISPDVTVHPGLGWAPGGAILATCATVVYLFATMQTPPIASSVRASTPATHDARANTPRSAMIAGNR
ncbi:hypothetical protein [Bradyrhizobium sp. CCBAU 53338]|uniref:hypothetical protein n=1 Tax=Bradyrhizobium sp. CCBAU 53338 TaxID=1325111 RepID=UPI00188D1E35|nr:hypothetical protein [Bradyrhizobium sp. CCBAU 53338]